MAAHPSTLAASLSRHLHVIRTLSLPALQAASADRQAIEEADAQLARDVDDAAALARKLRLCLDDAESEQERSDILAVIDEGSAALSELRTAARKARTDAYARAKTAAHHAARQELALLYSAQARKGAAQTGAAAIPRLGNASSAEGDRVQTASADVTSALQRAVQMLSTEVERSTFSASLLEESSATLNLLSSEYTSFSNVLSNSVTLIKSMEREDWYNWLIVMGSMAFFLGCVLYIIKVRLYDNTAGIVLSGASAVVGKGWRSGAKALKAAKASKSASASAASAASKSAASASAVIASASSASSRAAASLSAASTAAAAAAAALAAGKTASQAASSSTPTVTSAPQDVPVTQASQSGTVDDVLESVLASLQQGPDEPGTFPPPPPPSTTAKATAADDILEEVIVEYEAPSSPPPVPQIHDEL